MRKNILSVGTRTLTGEKGNIIAAGEVNFMEADVLKLSGAGEIFAENSYINLTKMVGEITAKNCSFGTLRLAGEMTAEGRCQADTVIVMGELTAESLECRVLRNYSSKNINLFKNKLTGETMLRYHKYMAFNLEKPADRSLELKVDFGNTREKNYINSKRFSKNEGSVFKGQFKAETFENLCDFCLNFQYQFTHILSTGMLHHRGIVECEDFYSFGPLDILGVNAEYVYIHPRKNSVLNQVMGSKIQITGKFFFDETFNELPKSVGQEVYESVAGDPAGVMEVELIEGDTVTVDHVNVKKISADKINIGENCVIECAEYKSDIQISPSAFVREVIRL